MYFYPKVNFCHLVQKHNGYLSFISCLIIKIETIPMLDSGRSHYFIYHGIIISLEAKKNL